MCAQELPEGCVPRKFGRLVEPVPWNGKAFFWPARERPISTLFYNTRAYIPYAYTHLGFLEKNLQIDHGFSKHIYLINKKVICKIVTLNKSYIIYLK